MQLRPYGDTANDGIVQISFTLPLPLDSRARETARRYAMLMGVSNPLVAHAESIDKQFSFFIVYGACTHTMGGRRHPAWGRVSRCIEGPRFIAPGVGQNPHSFLNLHNILAHASVLYVPAPLSLTLS